MNSSYGEDELRAGEEMRVHRVAIPVDGHEALRV